MKKYVTLIGKSFITEVVIIDGKYFLEVAYDVLIPFETEHEFEVVELRLNDLGKSMYAKYKFSERVIASLRKQIEDNYSEKHLDKYFKSLVTEEADFGLVSKLARVYSDFLKELFENGKWSDANQAINKMDIPRIDKAVEREKLFYQYYLEFKNAE